ncbi:uncharacterized protein GJ701_015951 isoform 1-T3 [Geothlypis trichas]
MRSNLIKQEWCALTAAHHSLAGEERRLADLCMEFQMDHSLPAVKANTAVKCLLSATSSVSLWWGILEGLCRSSFTLPLHLSLSVLLERDLVPVSHYGSALTVDRKTVSELRS